jgi:hypothetical protein
MPLVKELYGRRIVKTQCCGDWIRVRLAPSGPGKPRQWVTVTPARYRAEMTCRFEPRSQT